MNLVVLGEPYSSQSAYSALQFCRAAVAVGHSISQVFFYRDGVGNANKLSTPLSDEFAAVPSWEQLAREHEVSLVVCVSAGERRGVIGTEQADDHGLDAHNVSDSFQVAGLGVLHEASLLADRTVTFK